jgi:hypothetical protein
VLARLAIQDGVLDSTGRASYSRIKIKKSRIAQHLISVGGTKDVVRMTRADRNFQLSVGIILQPSDADKLRWLTGEVVELIN